MSLPQPSSESELQLFQVLQRANLLQYYNTFISQGGDDVQQLCEAGEEEFLEIMALVGMASKPLHVRRLQKALQEWALNPVNFHQSLGVSPMTPILAQGSILASVQKRSSRGSYEPPASGSGGTSSHPRSTMEPMWTAQAVPVAHTIEPRQVLPSAQGGPSVNQGMDERSKSDSLEGASIVTKQESQEFTPTVQTDGSPEGSTHSGSALERASSLSPVPGFASHRELTDAQLKAIELAAEELAKTLPQYEIKLLNMKKQINKDIEEVIQFTTDNPTHPDNVHLMRKYGAIYGRFDSKRKGEKPMSLHEISVNEASAQLCRHRPSLLTRREDLFPLARQVVRASGYQYSKGHSRSGNSSRSKRSSPSPDPEKAQSADILSPNKRQRLDMTATGFHHRPELDARLMEISQEIASITRRQDELKGRMEEAKGLGNLPLVHTLQTELENFTSKQLLLLTEQSEIGAKQRKFREQGSLTFSMFAGKPSSLNGSDDDDSLQDPSESSSPHNSSDPPPPFFPSSFGKPSQGNESLFDAGMRIAQAYGLGEFAQELKGLQDDDASGSGEQKSNGSTGGVKTEEERKEVEEEVDEQEEWNREVEEDWRRQAEALKDGKQVEKGMKINVVIKEEEERRQKSPSS